MLRGCFKLNRNTDFRFYASKGPHRLSSIFVRASCLEHASQLLDSNNIDYRKDTGKSLGYMVNLSEIIVLRALGEKTLGFK